MFGTKVASIWISFFPSLLVNKGVTVLKGEREKLRLIFRTTVSRKKKMHVMHYVFFNSSYKYKFNKTASKKSVRLETTQSEKSVTENASDLLLLCFIDLQL